MTFRQYRPYITLLFVLSFVFRSPSQWKEGIEKLPQPSNFAANSRVNRLEIENICCSGDGSQTLLGSAQSDSALSGKSSGHLTDSSKTDSVRRSGAWNWIKEQFNLRFSFLSKLSGPGPFMRVGITSHLLDNVRLGPLNSISVRLAASYGTSVANDLTYDTITTVMNPIDSTLVRVRPFKKSTTVNVFSLQPSFEYRFPNSSVQVGVTIGAHLFSGEAFPTLGRISLAPQIAFRPCWCYRIGFLVNALPGASADTFGAQSGLDNNGIEYVWEFFHELSFDVF